jgi:hypothetical protein
MYRADAPEVPMMALVSEALDRGKVGYCRGPRADKLKEQLINCKKQSNIVAWDLTSVYMTTWSLNSEMSLGLRVQRIHVQPARLDS